MGEKADKAKGRAKEALGDLTDNEEMQREGQSDQTGGEIKEKASDAVDKVKDKINDVLDRDR